MTANQEQIGGDHYKKHGIQPWDVLEDWGRDLVGVQAFCFGCILKYLCRYRDKYGVEDLKKARHYMDKLIETYEK